MSVPSELIGRTVSASIQDGGQTEPMDFDDLLSVSEKRVDYDETSKSSEVAPPEVLTVKSLNLNVRENVTAHHTNEFDITDILQHPNKEECLVVRRGQGFEISVEFNRAYDAEKDDLRFVFTFGSEEERAAVRTANLRSTRPGLYEPGPEDVQFELSASDDSYMGDPVDVILKATNTSNEIRTLSGRLALSTMYYTGVHCKNVNFVSIKDKVLQKGQSEEIKLTTTAEQYLDHLVDHCLCRISCMVGIKETKQTHADLNEVRLRKPHLEIKAPQMGKCGEKFKVDASFKNTLPVTLTDCELRVEGPGIQLPVTYKQGNVEGKKEFLGSFEMTPAKTGEREIVVYFNSKQISAVTGTHIIKIE